MLDFSRVLRKSLPAVQMLLGDQSKHLLKLGQRRLTRVHQRVAPSESRDFGDPRAIVLAVKDDLVIVKAHGAIIWRAGGRPGAHRGVLVSPLLEVLERCVTDPDTASDEEAQLFCYGLYLLAKWRETRAYPLVIGWVSLSDAASTHLSGDALTQDGARILAAVCDGDLEPIKRLVANRDADEFSQTMSPRPHRGGRVLGGLPQIAELRSWRWPRLASSMTGWRRRTERPRRSDATNRAPVAVERSTRNAAEDERVNTHAHRFPPTP